MINKPCIPDDFIGKWYFSSETLFSITKEDNFNIKDFCQNLAIAELISEREELEAINEVFFNLQQFASTVVLEVFPYTVKAEDLPDILNLDSLIFENEEVILNFSYKNKDDNNEKLIIKKSPSNDFLYVYDDKIESYMSLVNKPVIIPNDFLPI